MPATKLAQQEAFGTTNRRALRSRMRETAMHDGYYFNTKILGWDKFYEPLHRPLCNWFYRDRVEKFALTLCPRGHYKTTIGAEGKILHSWLKKQDLRYLIVHQKREIAEKALGQIKFHAEENDKLQFIAPDVFYKKPSTEAKRWLKDEIDIKRTKWHRVPSAKATGVDATVTGLHFDRIILDDIVTEDNSTTSEQLEQPKVFIQRVNPLLIDKTRGQVDVIGTRWHPNDAYGWMLETFTRGFCSNIMAALDEDGEPIFPTEFSRESLLDMAEHMGSFQFSCLMMNNPVPSDTKMFPEEQVQWCDILPDKPLMFFTAIDPNRGEKSTSDPGVIATFARDSDGNFYEAEITHRKFNVDDLAQEVRRHVATWNPQKVIIETTAGQNYLHYWLQQEQVENNSPYTLVPVSRGPTSHKYQRILRIQPVVERGHLFLKPGHNPLFEEIKTYPFGKDDHCLDALADIVQLGYAPVAVKPKVVRPRGAFVLQNIIGKMQRQKAGLKGRVNPQGKRW